MPLEITDITTYINGCHMMRDGALERLTDEDLTRSPGGDNLTLGELFKQLGEHQHTYVQSLIHLQQDWSYRNHQPGLATSVDQLQQWFQTLDSQMSHILNDLTPDDLHKQVDRTNGSVRPVISQLDIYIQLMLIFLGKVVVYFRAMQKPLPPSIAEYIG